MKSIRDFITGKIRRSEAQDRLRLVVDGADHPDLGRFEGRLDSDVESVEFYADGVCIPGVDPTRYDGIQTVMMSPPQGDRRTVDIVMLDRRSIRLDCTDDGGRVVHATLRWVGNVLLRRKIAG